MKISNKPLLGICTALLITSCGPTKTNLPNLRIDYEADTVDYVSIIKPTLDSLVSALKDDGLTKKSILGREYVFSRINYSFNDTDFVFEYSKDVDNGYEMAAIGYLMEDEDYPSIYYIDFDDESETGTKSYMDGFLDKTWDVYDVGEGWKKHRPWWNNLTYQSNLKRVLQVYLESNKK
ncbi:MAG TPA: hypothetical protein VJH92_06570 [Candidatus Nanoarchaeia archaeon]|nr:hypothetical protein [Candidatus Nanoarchaeia archaeon]